MDTIIGLIFTWSIMEGEYPHRQEVTCLAQDSDVIMEVVDGKQRTTVFCSDNPSNEHTELVCEDTIGIDQVNRGVVCRDDNWKVFPEFGTWVVHEETTGVFEACGAFDKNVYTSAIPDPQSGTQGLQARVGCGFNEYFDATEYLVCDRVIFVDRGDRLIVCEDGRSGSEVVQEEALFADGFE